MTLITSVRLRVKTNIFYLKVTRDRAIYNVHAKSIEWLSQFQQLLKFDLVLC